MTDRPFQRPGSSHEPQSELWPYHPPPVDPEPMLLSSASQRIAEPGSGIDDPPRTTASAVRWRGVRMVVAAAVGGFVLGGITTGLLSTVFFPRPEPVPVTVDTFPEHILGVEREDLSARSIGDVEALQQFDANFRDQIPRFQFAHGGPGAAVNYGQVLTLTIVDGYQSLPLPKGPRTGSATGPPTLVSLESDDVSCVFQPTVGLYDSAVLDSPADLTAKGSTDCVLNDPQRNLSLRITSRVPGDATRTSNAYRGVLERLHVALIS